MSTTNTVVGISLALSLFTALFFGIPGLLLLFVLVIPISIFIAVFGIAVGLFK